MNLYVASRKVPQPGELASTGQSCRCCSTSMHSQLHHSLLPIAVEAQHGLCNPQQQARAVQFCCNSTGQVWPGSCAPDSGSESAEGRSVGPVVAHPGTACARWPGLCSSPVSPPHPLQQRVVVCRQQCVFWGEIASAGPQDPQRLWEPERSSIWWQNVTGVCLRGLAWLQGASFVRRKRNVS